MPAHVRLEFILIAILLPIVAFFAFWYVPLSIDAPQGFGADSEVSPRFAPYLLAALMAAAMIGRLLQLGLLAARDRLHAIPDDLGGTGTQEETRRGIVLNIVVAIYGFLLVPVIGFYAASFVLVTYLVHRLGEQRPVIVAVIGALSVVFIYLLFDELLSVRLPRGAVSSLIEG